MKRFFTVVITLIFFLCANANVHIVQPKIMVIPYTKEGEDIRTILESDENKRIILTKIKEAFDNRGVTTIDFVAKLKSIENGTVMNSYNKEDIKSQIIDMSGADIYVEAEMVYQKSLSYGKNSLRVKILLTAYDAATGSSLANKVGESGIFYTNDIGKLAMRAIDSCADDFLNVIQNKFSEISEEGRSCMLQIGFDEQSIYNMESEVGNNGLCLQDEIELWLGNNAYQGYYHMQGVSQYKMVIDDIKLPHIDETTGNNYTTSRFSLELLKFFQSLNIKISRSVRGNSIYITIK